MRKTTQVLLTLCMLFLSTKITAQTTGTVFRDFNGNGTRQNTAGTFVEPVVAGIIVNAYNNTDAIIASYVTAATGTFTIPLTASTYNGTIGSNTGSVNTGVAVRLEFVIPGSGTCNVSSSYDFSAYNGSTYGSSVRFITGGATAVNYAINDPSQYVFDAAPFTNTYLFTSVLFFGNPTASPAGTAANQKAFVKFPYNRSGNTTPLLASEILATTAQIGTTYGVAYSKQANKIFTSAFMKRHAGFGPANGTFNNAPGTIYIIDPTKNSTTSAASYFTSLDALGFPTHNTTGTPAYGAATSYNITVPVAGTGPSWFTREEKINYVGAGAGVIGTNLQRGLNKDSSVATNDPAAYDQIGKVSLGDMEISDDGQYLFVTNLYDRKIYQLQLNSVTNPTAATVVTSWALPNPPLRSASGITNAALTYTGANDNTDFYGGIRGLQRPFGLKYFKGKVYVGAVTTGEGASGTTTTDNNTGNPEYTDLWSYVWELTPGTGFNTTPMVQFPMNYNRTLDADGITETYNTWTSTTKVAMPTPNAPFFGYPQPILAGIEFDVDGSMIIAFRDRIGDQAGTANYLLSNATTAQRTVESYGDILRAYKNSGCTGWIIEANGDKDGPGPYTATSGSPITSFQQNNQGPSNYAGGNGEFYFQDGLEMWGGTNNGTSQLYHLNTNEGALAFLPGTEEITGTTMDPMRYVSQGVSWYSNNTGTNPRDYELYVGGAFNVNPGEPAKGNGMGDMELLVNSAPVEVGNRVWNDANGDGIQEAGEAGISGVTLEIFVDNNNDGVPDGALIGTTTTAAAGDIGSWYFNNANITGDADPNTAGTQATLTTGVRYLVRPAASAWTAGAGTGNLSGLQLTKTDKAGNGQTDFSDNDASLFGATPIPQISILINGVGQNNHNFDFGFKTLASLGDKVWRDDDKNGSQTATEPGVAGVTVTLKNNAGTVVATTVTDALGNYLFDNLTPADYTVTVTLPANYTFTTQTNTTDDNNTTGASTTGSDVNITTGQSYTVTLSAGENNRNVDAGLIFNTPAIPNSIGNRVWLDTDSGGDQDAGEPGVAGVTVTLYAADGVTIVATTITDANGNYLFNNLPANTGYILGFTPPAGMVFTTTTGTTLGIDTDSDVEASTFSPNFGRTGFINSGAAGTAITQVDAGLIPQTNNNASLGDKVWNDINSNGTQDAGEPGIAGVTVNLYHDVNGDGVLTGGELTAVRSVVTDAFGNYTFNNLTVTLINKYQVEFIQPAGYNNTPVANNNSGNDVTDSDITNDATDRTDFIRLKWNERNTSVDAGFVQAAPAGTLKLGDKVWRDDNGDGQQGATEPGLAGVTVKLYQNGTDGLPGTADDVLIANTATDINGSYLFVNLAASASAATNYNVQFSNIPSGFSFTVQDAGADATDNDANSLGKTGSYNLTADNLTVDAGISQGVPSGLASLGDRVWYDLNNNGAQDAGELGAAGVTVNLYLDANNDGQITGGEQTAFKTTTTNALGEYMFGGLNAGNYQVGFTLPAALSAYTLSTKDASGVSDALDSDGNPKNTSVAGNTAGAQTSYTALIPLATGEDKITVDLGIVPPANTNTLGGTAWFDTDSDGTQTANPGRVPGVVVNLYNSAGTLIATTTTDDNGDYLFVGLADGDYSVAFAAYPAGFDLTTKSTANDAIGSDADIVSGRTATVTLNAGNRNDRTLDGGLISTRAALGNRVWEDLDADGIQDAGEPGVPGVTVTLFDGLSNIIATAITDFDGYYFFPNLNAGNYQVGFTTLPAGMEFTTKDNTTGPDGDGANTWIGGGDSDVNPTGANASKTDVFTLAAGQVNLTKDAGIRRTPIATVGNRVWDDVNGDGIQDAGEPGIAGVIAILYNSANQPIGSAVTDGNGMWLITNVPTGTGYYVIFTNKPIGNFTVQDNGGPGTGGAGDSDTDSDANATGQTGTFDVTPNTINVKIDAGITSSIVLPVTLVSFTAKPQGSQTAIQWVVANQINIAAYAVEYSKDGVNFKTIETITANTATGYTYSTIDVNPAADVNYYRLRIIEPTGKNSYSDIKKVVFNKEGIITVWPNPFTEKVSVNITLKATQKVVFTVIDARGSVVKQENISLLKGANLVTVDGLQLLPKGPYLLQLVSIDGTVKFVQKLVKE